MRKPSLLLLPIAASSIAGAQGPLPGFPDLPGFRSQTPLNLTDLNYYQNWANRGGLQQSGGLGYVNAGFGHNRGTGWGRTASRNPFSRFNQCQYGPLPRSTFLGFPNCDGFGPSFATVPFGTNGFLSINGARYGYYHFNPLWSDTWFFFPYYSFSPVVPGSVFPSPWYPYVSLPPYISSRGVQILVPVFINWTGSTYQLGTDASLDSAIGSLVDLYRSGNRSIVDRFIPNRERVDIMLDGSYRYSLRPNDFGGVLLDGVLNNRTQCFTIESVERNQNTARVRARHEAIDPWGGTVATRHEFLLKEERNVFVIRQFGVSKT